MIVVFEGNFEFTPANWNGCANILIFLVTVSVFCKEFGVMYKFKASKKKKKGTLTIPHFAYFSLLYAVHLLVRFYDVIAHTF